MSGSLRHRDGGQWLASFAERVDVSCPRCGRAGVVRATWAQRPWTVVFRCTHCQLDAHSERDDWLGQVRLVGRRPCGYCGHQWLCVNQIHSGAGAIPIQLDEHRRTPSVDPVPARCPICHRSSEVAVQAQRERDREGHDPHFGLPLRLTERTRAGLLWAYNAEHIDELRRYIAADQRERYRATSNKSMISRLPTWMKLARHRAMMLKALDRLAAKLDAPRVS